MHLINTVICILYRCLRSHLSEIVIENIKILESYISGICGIFRQTEDNNQDITNDNLDVVKAGNLMKYRSPFGKHFINISQQCDINVSSQHNTGEANPYSLPRSYWIFINILSALSSHYGVVLYWVPIELSIDGKKYSHCSNAISSRKLDAH